MVELTPELEASIESVVEGWYADRSIDWDDLFDRVERYGHDLPTEYDDPLALAVKRYARKVKRDIE